MIPASIVILVVLLFSSIGVNAYLLLKTQHTKKRPDSKELQEFLSDISRSAGILAVTRIDPEDVLVRSPRQRR